MRFAKESGDGERAGKKVPQWACLGNTINIAGIGTHRIEYAQETALHLFCNRLQATFYEMISKNGFHCAPFNVYKYAVMSRRSCSLICRFGMPASGTTACGLRNHRIMLS